MEARLREWVDLERRVAVVAVPVGRGMDLIKVVGGSDNMIGHILIRGISTHRTMKSSQGFIPARSRAALTRSM